MLHSIDYFFECVVYVVILAVNEYFCVDVRMDPVWKYLVHRKSHLWHTGLFPELRRYLYCSNAFLILLSVLDGEL